MFEILLQLRFVFSLTLVHLSGHSFIPIRTHAYLFPTLSKNIFLINPVLETELMFTSEMALQELHLASRLNDNKARQNMHGNK